MYSTPGLGLNYNKYFSSTVFDSLDSRLAALLVENASDDKVKPKLSEWAELLFITYRHLLRTLNKFIEKGKRRNRSFFSKKEILGLFPKLKLRYYTEGLTFYRSKSHSQLRGVIQYVGQKDAANE